jgi:hypothetical protein
MEMGGMLTGAEVFEQIRTAAVQATAPDERALQIDYDSLRQQILAALDGRRVRLVHINRYLPEGYEEQGRFNALVLTVGHVLYDMVVGDSYFRYDIVSVGDLDKVQVIDAVWENREKRQEEPFLSLRLMHAEEAHLLLALDEKERQNLLAFARAVGEARNPERG